MAASRPPTPTGPQALAELALSAIAGGAALGLTGVPAGWLSGAMLGVAALAGARRAPLLPAVLRRVAVTLAGVGMGAGLTPQTISTLSHYPVTLALMACALVAMTGASFLVLRRSPGFSPATAF